MDNDTLITVYKLFTDIYHGIINIMSLPVVTALAGVVITQLLQIRSKKIELEHQVINDKQQFKREIIEKILTGYFSYEMDINIRIHTYSDIYRNMISREIGNNHIKKHLSNNTVFADNSRIYFPHFFEHYSTNIYPIYLNIEKLTLELSNDSFTKENYNLLQSYAQKFEHESELLINKIRHEIINLGY